MLAGCVVPGSGRTTVSARTQMVWVEDDYDYYPGYETYYSRTHGYYYYRDGNNWVRRNDPPRNWVSGTTSVQVHFKDAPDRHHVEMIKRYPKNWHAAQPKGTPRDNRAYDARDDHDNRGHDEHGKRDQDRK